MYDNYTEVLTPYGWCRFENLIPGTYVAQIHDDHSLEFVQPLQYIESYYQGPMYHWKDGIRRIDLLVTPDHIMTVKNLHPNCTNHDWQYIQSSNLVFYQGIKIYRSGQKKSGIDKLSSIDRLRIAFQADGSGPTGDGSRMGSPVYHFGFKKQRKIDRLIQITEDCGLRYIIRKDNNQYTWFRIFCDVHMDKEFSWINLSDVSSSWCCEFLEELYHWDGSINEYNSCEYSNTRKIPCDKVCAIASLSGLYYHYAIAKQPTNPKHNPVYRLNWTKDIEEGVDGQSINRNSKIVNYSASVYNVVVPSKRLLIRRFNSISVSSSN